MMGKLPGRKKKPHYSRIILNFEKSRKSAQNRPKPGMLCMKNMLRCTKNYFAIFDFWIDYTLERPQTLKKPKRVGVNCEIFRD